MPSLSYNTLKKIKKIESYPIFIETGSYRGETIFHMENYFDELHTIEIKKSFYENLTREYRGDKITFHLGDSSIILNSLVETLERQAVFFLDGHWSAQDTGKGKKHVPLYEELDSIHKKFKHKCIIIIDDYRLFGTWVNDIKEPNWSDINKDCVLGILNDRTNQVYHLPSTLHEKDRLVIHLNSL
jgi:hypothetical protein